MENASANCPSCGSVYPAGATFCPTCGYVLPAAKPAGAVNEQQAMPAPAPSIPQSNVVYVQPAEAAPREAGWGPWIALIVLALVVAGGIVFWNLGYLGSSSPVAPASTSVTIDNSAEPPATPEPGAPPPAAAVPPPPASPATPPGDNTSRMPAVDIISVEGRALEKNAYEWRYGYTLRIRNNTDGDVKSSFRVQFLDAQDFPVDDDVMSDLVIPARTEMSFDGEDMIKAPLAERIKTLRAEVR